jgi:EmrB/QacA subfamily drug resistance transporter
MDGAIPRSRSRWLALAGMLLAVAMTYIDQTVVAIATPDLATELGLTRSGSQWVVTAYLIALAAGFALGGRLTDVFGSRPLVLIGVAGFAATSALCGFTPTGPAATAWLVTFRALQGLSAAAMIPAALAVVVTTFPVGDRGRALAIFFAIGGAFTALGPLAGGYLTQWTWRSIFWINIPVAVAAVVVTVLAGIPGTGRRGSVDVRGAVLIGAGMALSILGLDLAAEWGWDDARTWACLLGGLMLIGVFVLAELRTRQPLLRLRIFRDRAFAVDSAVLFFAMVAFVPVFFFASVYAQVALGYDSDGAGLYLLVFFVGYAPAAQLRGRMLDTGGAKLPMVIGGALGAVGFAGWAVTAPSASLGSQWWALLLAGAGTGFLIGPASTDAVNRAIDASYGEVTGITQTIRNYASALGLSVFGALLSNVLTSRLTGSLVASGVPAGQAASLAAVAASAEGSGADGSRSSVPIPDIVQSVLPADFAAAARPVFAAMAIALALCLVCALLHPGGRAAGPGAPGGAGGGRASGGAGGGAAGGGAAGRGAVGGPARTKMAAPATGVTKGQSLRARPRS